MFIYKVNLFNLYKMAEPFSIDIDNRAHKAFKKVKEDIKKLQEENKNLSFSLSSKKIEEIENKITKLEAKYEILLEQNQKLLTKNQNLSQDIAFLVSTQKDMRTDIINLENELRKVSVLELNKRVKELEQHYLINKEHLNSKNKENTNKENTNKKNNENYIVEEENYSSFEDKFKKIEENSKKEHKKGGFAKWFFSSDEDLDKIEEVYKDD